MHILHTESSNGWGGQEMRILREALALKEKGHHLIFAVQNKGKLVDRAKQAGITVYELDFRKKAYPVTLLKLYRIIKKENIDLVVTHSSSDSWIGGIAAKLAFKKVVRLRHLSTKIKEGLNSKILYNTLVDYIVTTSKCIIPMIHKQSGIDLEKINSVPTGVDPQKMLFDPDKVKEFRKNLGLKDSDILVGTVCVVRSWKGIEDLLQAAFLLKEEAHIKWVVIGGGYLDHYRPLAKEFGLEANVFFTGHLEDPVIAIAALDIFTLLSTANEGVSQASLQAAYLEKPLITTPIGGLPEVCIDHVTGFLVPPKSPQEVVDKVLALQDSELRKKMGVEAKKLIEQSFLFEQTTAEMEKIYLRVKG